VPAVPAWQYGPACGPAESASAGNRSRGEKPYRPVPIYGISVREIRGRASLTLFIDRVIDGGPDTVTGPDDALSMSDNPI
jgi:hypothetical protein